MGEGGFYCDVGYGTPEFYQQPGAPPKDELANIVIAKYFRHPNARLGVQRAPEHICFAWPRH